MTTALSVFQGVNAEDIEFITAPSGKQTRPFIEPLTFAPEPEAVESAKDLPEKSLRDELVAIYFRHVHPLLPVIDEYEFVRIYKSCSNEDELSQQFDIMLFQAMMFMAFAYMAEDQLARTPYESIPQAQKDMMEKVKILYSLRSTTDPIVLTQVCLLLTFWSPYDSDTQVNCYWVDRAFHHARTGRIWDPDNDSGTMHSRNKIIWWCCLNRDRQTSFALRRLHRMRENDSAWTHVTELDFGAEAFMPSFTDIEGKKAIISAFIWLCKLGDLIAEIGMFQLHSLLARGQAGDTTDLMAEMTRISDFEYQLQSWRKQFMNDNQPYLEKPMPQISKVTLLFLQVIHASLVTALYRPYLHISSRDGLFESSIQTMTLRKMKETSPKLIKRFVKMISHTPIQDIPLAVVAWINFPFAVCQLGHHFNHKDPYLPTAMQMEEVMSFFRAFSRRFSGALTSTTMMRAVGHLLEGKKPSEEGERLGKRRRTSVDTGVFKRTAAIGDHNDTGLDTDDETRLLDVIAGFIDLSLAADDNIPAEAYGTVSDRSWH
ncbi:hypothetical protein NA57DRAFT_80874 [Rhizodiscina lignyota]|uniref:Xylanolytic transcriptional activator regulatory domain-containing protein n=1 Tax=Rhizodiscina lignyota TaxID=1504668 RepID=A0A9P4I5J1_9PEZI|nr:hypothetical protein NA57DRAFT_80874 [Rhizodiscina lignyota]